MLSHETVKGSRRSTFWFAYWLAVLLCVVKLVQLGLPVSWDRWRLWDWVKDLLVATAADT